MTQKKTTITQDGYHPETETALPKLYLSQKSNAVIGNIQKHVKACVLALSVGLAGSVYADDTAKGADITLASSSEAASVDAEGVGIDDALKTLSIEDIEVQIADIQQQIDVLEVDADNLPEEQWIELDELYQRLAELENQQSQLIGQQIAEEKSETVDQEAVIKEQDAAIKTKTRIVKNLATINGTLGNN